MSQELNELEHDLKLAKSFVVKGEKLQQLYRSPAFKELILNDYIKDETLRLHSLLAQFKGEQREAVIAELDAISRFKAHLNYVEQFALSAEDKVKEIEEGIREIQDESYAAAKEVEVNTSYEA